jgi:hypothetical protein
VDVVLGAPVDPLVSVDARRDIEQSLHDLNASLVVS